MAVSFVVVAVATLASATSPPPPVGSCDASRWFNGYIPWNKQQPRAPFAVPVPTDSAAACCSLCNNATNRELGCRFWYWAGPGPQGSCYMKTSVTMCSPRPAKDGVSGSIYTFAPTPAPTPAPPTPPPLPPLPPPPTPAPTPWDGKPVKVFILMGQSNMLGEGTIMEQPQKKNGTLEFAVREEGKFQYLLTPDQNNWAVLPNTRNVFIMGSGNATFNQSVLQHNEFMTVPGKTERGSHTTIGPEFGIAGKIGTAPANTMLLKSCIGDRALGWDLLPPGTQRWDYTGGDNVTYTYAGYKDSPMKWKKADPKPAPNTWYAGKQWDGDTANAKYVLDHIEDFYPGAQAFEIAGFFWWQGDKDSRDPGLAARYEYNLVNLIKTLRATFKAPNAPFVTASLGQTVKGSTSGDGLILDAMLNVDGESGKYPEFKGNVAAVYTHPLEHSPGSSGAHYGRDAETYMNVGEAMGAAMAKLLAVQKHA